tara:strand:+ start:1548 stop:2114 length:567 start_codon:yes stop_codon:yes gene_type:complete
MTTLVLFLEERSAQVFLDGLLPRILPEGVTYRAIVFEGKQDLEKQIERRLRGWCLPNSTFLVLRDQDASDCAVVKKSLTNKATKAGQPRTVIRIACQELESWYFGDLEAVEEAIGITNLSRYSNSAKYRVPDAIVNPASELLKITGKRYQKISHSRELGKILDLENNSSHSFNVFVGGLMKAIAQIHP